jgi:glycosyltransferase involved in cell wall biosynthesis
MPDSPLISSANAGFDHLEPFEFIDLAATFGGSAKNARISVVLRILPRLLRSCLSFRRQLGQQHIDALVCFDLWLLPYALFIRMLTRTRVVFDFHETFSVGGAARLLPAITRLVDLVITPSHYLIARYHLGRCHHKVVPRPVGGRRLPERPTFAYAGVTFGIFGQVAEHKRVLELVNSIAFANAAGVSARLLVVGGCQTARDRTVYETRVRRHVAKLSFATVFDAVDDVEPLMISCDYICNLSDHEAFGRTVIEALALGRFPVVYEETGPAEIVTAAGDGRIVRRDEDLSFVVIELARSPRRVSISAMRRTRDLYRPHRVSSDYFNAIASVLSA